MKSYSKYTCFPAIFPVTPAKSPYTFGEEKLSVSEFPSNFPRTSEPSLELAVEIQKTK